MTGIIPLKKGENITSFFAVNKVRRLVGEKKADTVITSVEKALMSYPEITVTKPQANRFHNGGALGYERLHGNFPVGIYRVY